MYWSGVPRGQIPPPTVDDPVAHICPVAKTRHCTRLAVKMSWAWAKSWKPLGLPGFGFATATDEVATQSARIAAADRTITR